MQSLFCLFFGKCLTPALSEKERVRSNEFGSNIIFCHFQKSLRAANCLLSDDSKYHSFDKLPAILRDRQDDRIFVKKNSDIFVDNQLVMTNKGYKKVTKMLHCPSVIVR
jgi:hypothetical protein